MPFPRLNDVPVAADGYSPLSPFNPSTSTPPILVKHGKVIAFLTVNRSIRGR